jgi:FkbM family methyltransferase
VSPNTAENTSLLRRCFRFIGKPWKQKKQSFGFRYLRWVPHAFLPVHLPIKAWWFAESDFMGSALLWEGFENAEYELAKKVVQPGTIALDIGAHKGFYTLLLSRAVGANGRVLAFEPSRRERARLRIHVRVNSCRNVSVFDFALGQNEDEGTLFVVQGTETGLNSLRPLDKGVLSRCERVRIRSLDAVLLEQGLSQVDFVKIDVEGAELSVFSGANRLLTAMPRPVILAEVSDVRTKQWGYEAKNILSALESLRFTWLAVRPGGMLAPVDTRQSFYDANFLAVPEEKMDALRKWVLPTPGL